MSATGERYEQMASPALDGLGYLAKAQVVNAINTQLLAEVVEALGGEVILPPGFGDRVGAQRKHIVETRFLDDGSYRLRTVPLEPEVNHPGAGTRWERMEGPRRGGQEVALYEVETMDETMATLKRIRADGSPVAGALLVSVQVDYLRRGVGGWQRWSPPLEVIEGLGGS